MTREKVIGGLLATGFLLFAGAATFVSQGCATSRIRPSSPHADAEIKMTVTAYCNCGKCCSWHRNWYGRPVYDKGPNKGKKKVIGQTASGRRAGWGTAAVDTRYYPFGTIFYIPDYGYARAEDTGGAIKGDHIDLWFPGHLRAKAWGSKRLAVKVWYPRGFRPPAPEKPAPAPPKASPAAPAKGKTSPAAPAPR